MYVCFIANLTYRELVKVTTTMLRGLDHVWDDLTGTSRSLPEDGCVTVE